MKVSQFYPIMLLQLTGLAISFSLRQNHALVSIFLFWAIVTSLCLVSGIILLKWQTSIIPALALGNVVVIAKIFIYPSVLQLPDYDAFSETQYASVIQSTGHWIPTAGVAFATNYYGYFPMLHLWLASLSDITGLTLLAISKYFVIFFFTGIEIIPGYIADGRDVEAVR